MFFSKRVYKSSVAYKKTIEVVDALNNLDNSIKIGKELFFAKYVPILVISLNTIAYATIIENFRHTNLVITVYKWKWGKNSSESLIKEECTKQINNTDTIINVIERMSNSYENTVLAMNTEVTIPFNPIQNQKVLQQSTFVAKSIVEDFNKGNNAAKVYVLHGPPGTGKTTTIRLLCNLLDGMLFQDYNPTDGIVSIRELVNDWGSNDETLIIAFEEFDVQLNKIITDQLNVDSTNKKFCCFRLVQ